MFHSEDDFKLEMAMVIKRLYPSLQIRLERPISIGMVNKNGEESVVRAPIDILLIAEDSTEIPIELKYKTKRFKDADIRADGEAYSLADQGATDIGKVSFRKDIYRVEQLIKTSEKRKEGYVFVITNDNYYFDTNTLEKPTLNRNYSFHQGIVLSQKDPQRNYNDRHQNNYYQKEGGNRWY